MRFQALMPDVLHWLGIQKIDNMVSMSDMYVLYVLSSRTHFLANQQRLPHSDGIFPSLTQ
jgi:GTP cyclohydrolase II